MEWLLSLLKAFSDLVPRPLGVTKDQRIVFFVLGFWPISMPPFIYLIWPVLWPHEVVQVSECVTESQIVIDGVKSRFDIVYRVTDARKSVIVVTDAEISTRTVVDSSLVNGPLDLDQINEECERFGVEVLAVNLVCTGIPTIDVNG